MFSLSDHFFKFEQNTEKVFKKSMKNSYSLSCTISLNIENKYKDTTLCINNKLTSYTVHLSTNFDIHWYFRFPNVLVMPI